MRNDFKHYAALAALALLTGGCAGTPGSTPDISGYAKQNKPEAAKVEIAPPGSKAWRLPPGYSAKPGAGHDGGAALFYERRDPAAYALASTPVALKPGCGYKYGCWVKTEGIQGKGDEGAKLCVEFYKDGKFKGGDYMCEFPSKIKGTNGWRRVEAKFIAPAEPVTATLTPYLAKGTVGKAYFDGFFLEELPVERQITILQPKFGTLDAEGGVVTLGFDVEGSGLNCLASVQTADGAPAAKASAPIANNRCELAFPALNPGAATLAIVVLDSARKEIVEERSLPVVVAAATAAAPPHACAIDPAGRARVGGKLFMPLGLYAGNIERKQLDKLAASPFNCVMPYQSAHLKLDGSSKNGVEAIRESLDALDAKGIKCIFSMKDFWAGNYLGYPEPRWMGAKDESASVTNAVNAFKDHPAILAWYLADEMPWSWAGRLAERRRLVNSLDPFHPTWCVYYQTDCMSFYASSCDVLGIDSYPINLRDTPASLAAAKQCLEKGNAIFATKEGIALWSVPQAHNNGVYDKEAAKDVALFKRKYRDPSKEEMRSLALLEAAYGAKGFIFYSYGDLWRGPAKENGDSRWAELCEVASDLKAFSPFIMSGGKLSAVPVAVGAGDIVAKGFRGEDGRAAVVVVGIGPGETRGTIDAGVEGLKSKFGKCTPLGGGKYLFAGNGICSDILEEPLR